MRDPFQRRRTLCVTFCVVVTAVCVESTAAGAATTAHGRVSGRAGYPVRVIACVPPIAAFGLRPRRCHRGPRPAPRSATRCITAQPLLGGYAVGCGYRSASGRHTNQHRAHTTRPGALPGAARLRGDVRFAADRRAIRTSARAPITTDGSPLALAAGLLTAVAASFLVTARRMRLRRL